MAADDVRSRLFVLYTERINGYLGDTRYSHHLVTSIQQQNITPLKSIYHMYCSHLKEAVLWWFTAQKNPQNFSLWCPFCTFAHTLAFTYILIYLYIYTASFSPLIVVLSNWFCCGQKCNIISFCSAFFILCRMRKKRIWIFRKVLFEPCWSPIWNNDPKSKKKKVLKPEM